ncbi:MAG TPA: lipocalin family protein [Vicinamibacteria bacterium]|nr:lipocalin family protein [Vicinamibacteria bacterium]
MLLSLLLPMLAMNAEITTVPHLDLERYQGKWYEVARLPNRFQRDCVGATAEYSLSADGKVSVLNTCYTEDGSLRTIRGSAKPLDETNARLVVRFEGLFFKLFSWLIKPNYWVIELDSEYRYAVVGTPDRKYLWVLSRDPEMAEERYRELIDRVAAQGFDVERILRTRVP